VMMMMICDKMK